MLDNLSDLILTGSIVTTTINLFLYAIKKHGLEKTLEELRNITPSMPYEDPTNEGAYRGMLNLLKTFSGGRNGEQ